jgi:hypothetical protein
MKKSIKLYFLITAMFLACTATVNAQQKASDRSFDEEVKKVNEKRAARNAFISKMRQSTPIENNLATPSNQNINTDTRTTVNPGPAATNQVPANLKPSQQPMKIPKKPAVIKQ